MTDISRRISISRRIFNRAYWDIKEATKRFVVVFGGSNSGKSYSMGQYLILNLLSSNESVIIFRKQGSTMRNSVYENLKIVAKSLKIFEEFNWYYSGDKREIVNKQTGARIVMSGLDDSEKIKSLAGFKRCVLEEANEFEEGDFKELDRRFRGMSGVQMYILFNPVSEEHWLKKLLFETDGYSKRAVHFRYTIDDNKYATQDDYDALEALKEIDETQYRIYRYAEWGIVKAINPYIWGFVRSVNIGKPVYNQKHPILIGFDYNVGNSCTIKQIYRDVIYNSEKQRMEAYWRNHTLKEYKFTGGYDNDLESLCKQVVIDWGHVGKLYFTGDASGNNKIATSEASKGANMLVESYLQKYMLEMYGLAFDYSTDESVVVFVKRSVNPRTAYSGWIISFLMKKLGANYMIHEDCTTLISDILKSKKLVGGSLDKKDADKHDYGHVMDSARYIDNAFGFECWKEMSAGISIPKYIMDME